MRDETQIHTHMCYSEFNDIIESIAALDADVISIEASRSDMELLDAFVKFKYPNEIGPGVYDIHSPRVPETEEIMGRLQKALRAIPAEQLWVNPDCGLKTRGLARGPRRRCGTWSRPPRACGRPWGSMRDQTTNSAMPATETMAPATARRLTFSW